MFFAVFFPPQFDIDSPFSLLSCLSRSLCWPSAGAYERCVCTRLVCVCVCVRALERSGGKERKGDKREHVHLLQSIWCSAYSANAT